MSEPLVGYAADGTRTAGCIPAKQKRTKEIEDCLLEVMALRNQFEALRDKSEVSKLLTREWRDWFDEFIDAGNSAIEAKYTEFRDRFTE